MAYHAWRGGYAKLVKGLASTDHSFLFSDFGEIPRSLRKVIGTIGKVPIHPYMKASVTSRELNLTMYEVPNQIPL